MGSTTTPGSTAPGDDSRWFREQLKDPELAREVERTEHDESLLPRASRVLIRAAIDRRYTLPAGDSGAH
jgi:hypothetical protein